jgi:divalent metal cation (Fe/Co/Zn/Cd) transporter
VHAEAVHTYTLPVIATFFSGILGVLITGYLKHAAQKTNSQMIKATSIHWMADTMLSFGVCAGFIFGLVAQNLGYTHIAPYVDPVMAIVLALFLAVVPLKGCRHNLVELLDAAPVTRIRAQIKKIVDAHKVKFLGLHRLRVRKAGQKIFINACFLTRGDMTVAQAEELSKGFEQDLKNNFSECDIIVHFKPQKA